jgi:hypothetical protein
MKSVALKKVPLVSPSGEKGELDYRVYSLLAIKQPLDGKSAGIDEMQKSIRLLNTMEQEGDVVEFEDADFDFFCIKVKNMRFTWVDPVFAQFVEDVTKGE